jgi:hypothetical protein
VNHEGTVKEFQRPYAIKNSVFSVACAWILVTAKKSAPSLEENLASNIDF